MCSTQIFMKNKRTFEEKLGMNIKKYVLLNIGRTFFLCSLNINGFLWKKIQSELILRYMSWQKGWVEIQTNII